MTISIMIFRLTFYNMTLNQIQYNDKKHYGIQLNIQKHDTRRTTFNTMTLSMRDLFVKLSINDYWHK
jgi:hypothetical protein